MVIRFIGQSAPVV